MKHLHSILLVVIIVGVTACKKSNPAPSTPSIAGYWAGFYVGTPTASGYSMLFRTNGTVRVYINADTSAGIAAEGTYVIQDSTVTTTCTYLVAGAGSPSFSTLGTWSNANNTIKGTEGFGENQVGAGTFSLTKQ